MSPAWNLELFTLHLAHCLWGTKLQQWLETGGASDGTQLLQLYWQSRLLIPINDTQLKLKIDDTEEHLLFLDATLSLSSTPAPNSVDNGSHSPLQITLGAMVVCGSSNNGWYCSHRLTDEYLMNHFDTAQIDVTEITPATLARNVAKALQTVGPTIVAAADNNNNVRSIPLLYPGFSLPARLIVQSEQGQASMMDSQLVSLLTKQQHWTQATSAAAPSAADLTSEEVNALWTKWKDKQQNPTSHQPPVTKTKQHVAVERAARSKRPAKATISATRVVKRRTQATGLVYAGDSKKTG